MTDGEPRKCVLVSEWEEHQRLLVDYKDGVDRMTKEREKLGERLVAAEIERDLWKRRVDEAAELAAARDERASLLASKLDCANTNNNKLRARAERAERDRACALEAVSRYEETQQTMERQAHRVGRVEGWDAATEAAARLADVRAACSELSAKDIRERDGVESSAVYNDGHATGLRCFARDLRAGAHKPKPDAHDELLAEHYPDPAARPEVE